VVKHADTFQQELNLLMKQLHGYNDIKDAGIGLLGKLAHIRGTTVKELYEEFDIRLDD
jgi:hypothetical protein